MSAGSRTGRRARLGALLCLLAALGAACGTIADDTAATVVNQVVTTTDVDELSTNAAFVELVLGQQPAPADSAVLPGELARSVLLFEIQRAGLVAELERWGVELDDAAVDAAREQVTAQAATAGGGRTDPAVLDRLATFVAARSALDARFAELDPDSDQDLRALYDGAPALWDRVCADIAQLPPEGAAAVAPLVARGATVDEVVAEVPGTEVLGDPSQGCIALEQLPASLRDAMRRAPVGELVGPVVITGGGQTLELVFVVDSFEQLSFADARDELVQLAGALGQQGAGTWLGLSLLGRVEINPRYGAGLSVGPSGQLEVVRPEAPPAVLPTDPFAAG